jgi:hypothetical protein
VEIPPEKRKSRGKKRLMSESGRVTNFNLFHGNVRDHVRNKPKGKRKNYYHINDKKER